MFHRQRFEEEYEPLYKELGYGTTTWSPLYGGLLTGKYNEGNIPEGSRASLKQFQWVKDRVQDEGKLDVTRQLAEVAEDLNVTMAQMSLAWLLKNPNVSTVITGASKVSQVEENMKAVAIKEKLTDDVMERINDIIKDVEG
jgi:aryl-alcohol dehydrogenase-like predicted oxidoreductase